MKPKHRQLPNSFSQVQAPPQYNSCKQISKKSSFKDSNHLPISNNYSISVKKQPKENTNYIYDSCTKQSMPKVKSSPYEYLPSIPRDQNKENYQNANFSSDRYYEKGRREFQRSQAGSIYEQFMLDQRAKKSFETEQSQENNGYQRQYYSTKPQIQTRRKQSVQTHGTPYEDPSMSRLQESKSQSRCIHKSPNFTKKHKHHNNEHEYYSMNHQMSSANEDGFEVEVVNRSQELIKKHINQKLDRVCEKIENLSREKDRIQKNCNQDNSQQQNGACVKWTNHSQNHTNRNTSLSHTPKSVHKISQHYQNHNYQTAQFNPILIEQNRIQHKILPPSGPTHIEFLQSHIIQLDKKIVFSNAKILKLQEQLLEEKQKLIKKQKQWLLRENELLNWIQANQVEEEILETQNPSPKRQDKSLKQTHLVKKNSTNVIVDDSKNKDNAEFILITQELEKYQKISQGLSQLLSEVMKIFKVNFNWLTLMNRTLSHQLPGTAFRVKEEMNLNNNSFLQLQKFCETKLTEYRRLSDKSMITPKLSIDSINSKITHMPSSHQNPSLSQSQVFLLESYCPPASQQFQIQTTKRNNSSIKPNDKQRKSVSCLSESKSVNSTNKKYANISTHKKSLNKEVKPIEPSKNNEKLNRNLYNSRKSEYFCDEVFYSRAKEINPSQVEGNQLKNPSNQQTDNQLYYLLSLQALTIETLIPHQPSNQSNIDQDNQQNLLSGMNP